MRNYSKQFDKKEGKKGKRFGHYLSSSQQNLDTAKSVDIACGAIIPNSNLRILACVNWNEKKNVSPKTEKKENSYPHWFLFGSIHKSMIVLLLQKNIQRIKPFEEKKSYGSRSRLITVHCHSDNKIFFYS